MQLAFQKDMISCMQPLLRDIQTQEQTQEVRVSDGMPDIGSILNSWGQVILRGKEWDGDTVTVNGGTMVWVQYLPEEGGAPESVECWLPFQMRWTVPDTEHEGVLLTQLMLKSVDARNTSARKMIVRTNVSALIQSMVHCQKELYCPDGLPEDVQLYTESYPVLLTAEAGEKAFSLEETFTPQQPAEKICGYWLLPEITEHRIMGDKVVFRGNAALNVLYQCQDGSLRSENFDLPFSQYSELDAEYEDNAEVVFWPVVTSLEMELEDNRFQTKAGISGQYEIRHRPVLKLVTDAYSPNRDVLLQQEQLELPGILESKVQTAHANHSAPTEAIQVVATQFLPQAATVQLSDSVATVTMQGRFQNMTVALEGDPQSQNGKWEEQIQIPTAEDCIMDVTMWPAGRPQSNLLSGQLQQTMQMKLQTDIRMKDGIPMVTGLELGEFREPNPNRPSLILRRAGEDTLWEIAKSSGSTVADIQKANNLQTEPEADRMLLIPVK